jgi:hypothetical protein
MFVLLDTLFIYFQIIRVTMRKPIAIVADFPIKELDPKTKKRIELITESLEPELDVSEEKVGVLWKLYKREQKKRKSNKAKEIERLLEEATKTVLTITGLVGPTRRAERKKPPSRRKEPVRAGMLETISSISEKEEKLGDIFSKLHGFDKEDIDQLIGLVKDYRAKGYRFAAVMGSRMSFELGGDYDLVFMGTRKYQDILEVIQEEIREKGQVEMIIVPWDLGEKETTYITYQPLSYVLLTNSLVLDDDAYVLLKDLELRVPPADVRDRYLELALSALNINEYVRDDFWASHAEEKRMRFDFQVIEGDSSKHKLALRTFKRCCLDFFPRAMFLNEMGRFPERSLDDPQTIYANMLGLIKDRNPELWRSLRSLRDLSINIISSKLMGFMKEGDVRAALEELGEKVPKAKMEQLKRFIPEGISPERMERLGGLLSEEPVSKKKLQRFKIDVMRVFREEAEEIINRVLEQSGLEVG